jgi:glutathione S-transferase
MNAALPMGNPPDRSPLSADEYTRAETVRWLHRIETAVDKIQGQISESVGQLRADMVIRLVYESDLREIRRQMADVERELADVRTATQARHDRLINRMWWGAAALAAITVSVVGLFLKAG